MIFRELPLAGAFVLEPERLEDERGFFARTFCREELEEHGLDPTVAQCSLSFNRRRGTLRGMHYQAPPAEEAKLVRCVRGAIHDVIVDLRAGSPTFLRHAAARLDADNRLALYVPPGFAHGFQTLADDTELYYQMSAPYAPEHARGFRHDDPELGIAWPLPVAVISERDRGLPPFAEREVR
jgi:dTDP-4-dehydrorhamnose 3,5-epimerase